MAESMMMNDQSTRHRHSLIDLPSESLALIFSFINLFQLGSLACVCRLFDGIINNTAPSSSSSNDDDSTVCEFTNLGSQVLWSNVTITNPLDIYCTQFDNFANAKRKRLTENHLDNIHHHHHDYNNKDDYNDLMSRMQSTLDRMIHKFGTLWKCLNIRLNGVDVNQIFYDSLLQKTKLVPVICYENLIQLTIHKLYLSDAYDLSSLLILTPRLEVLSLYCNSFDNYLFHIIRGKVYRSLKKLIIESEELSTSQEEFNAASTRVDVVSPPFTQLQYLSLKRVKEHQTLVECFASVNSQIYNNQETIHDTIHECHLNNNHGHYMNLKDTVTAHSDRLYYSTASPRSLLCNSPSYHSLHTCQLVQCTLPKNILFPSSLQYLEMIDCIGMHDMNIVESMKYLSQNLNTLILHANFETFMLKDDDVSFMLKEFRNLEFLDIRGHTLLNGRFFHSLCHSLNLEYLCIEHLISIHHYGNNNTTAKETRNMSLLDVLEQQQQGVLSDRVPKNHSVKHLFIYGDKRMNDLPEDECMKQLIAPFFGEDQIQSYALAEVYSAIH
ncbi:hypothetical protein C9374_010231 [Naegleria lovaniensis]|uniref:F-box domain-containing protein n=1 Tax=Naegleria lovaniensis TaxID=51637 RepID=A0AA88KJF4_NAELO|nr:uncharacterized protein C9374_010231 [Naegleria lovaniensis]KAG2374857.1 hypothetical protein C9374_010231 [Naegleria lovaniensis]